MQDLIRKRAKLAALMRTKVDRDMFGRGDITFAPVAELPTRLIGQLVKIAVCAPVVLGRSDWESTTIRLLNKVTRDIIDPSSARYRICMDLIEGWFKAEQIIQSTNLSKNIIYREMDNLRALDLLAMQKNMGSRPGLNYYTFTLADNMKKALIDLESGV